MKHEPIGTVDAQYICSFRPDPGGGYQLRCPAFPGLITFGETLEEARAMAREALELCVETFEQEGWPLPEPDTEPHETIRQIGVGEAGSCMSRL
jgi:predicted RNase H-like HicB family nuclease